MKELVAGEPGAFRRPRDPMTPPTDAGKCDDAFPSGWYLRALVILIALGGFLRFWHLGYNSLWLDEAETCNLALMPFSAIWQAMAGGGLTPPLFYWAEHVMLVFGTSETVLRFLPAVSGVIAIPVFYLAGREFLDKNAGLIAAAGCAVSPFLIQYSQDARAYTAALLFVACATLFFLRAMRSARQEDWLLFGLFSALAVWTHFYSAIAIASLVLYALLAWLPHLKAEIPNIAMLSAGTCLAVVLCLPLVFTLLPTLVTYTTSSVPAACGVQGLAIITGTLCQMAGSDPVLMWVMIALFAAGTLQMFYLDVRKGFFLLFVTVFVFVTSYILSYHMTMISRYLIFLNIVFLLGIAVSYRILCLFLKGPGAVCGVIAILLLVSAPSLATYYTGPVYEDWRGFAGKLQAQTGPGDIVVSVPGYVSQPLDYYYSAKIDGTTGYGATNVSEIEKIVQGRGNRTVWFVKTFDIYSADPTGQTNQWLSNHTRLVAQESDILLSVYP